MRHIIENDLPKAGEIINEVTLVSGSSWSCANIFEKKDNLSKNIN